MVVAFILAANNRSRSGAIVRSFCATTYHDGLIFHATVVMGVPPEAAEADAEASRLAGEARRWRDTYRAAEDAQQQEELHPGERVVDGGERARVEHLHDVGLGCAGRKRSGQFRAPTSFALFGRRRPSLYSHQIVPPAGASIPARASA